VELMAVGQVAARAGLATSAVRWYEQQGLISSTRTAGGARRYPRSVLRRLATLPEGRPPTAADWARLSAGWRARLDEQIAALTQLRDGLSSCIGCGCLSLERCALSNPGDVAATAGPGARWLSPALRRVPPVSNSGREGR
jgi:MerR family redox-sensitive transcriptional activator SoxR